MKISLVQKIKKHPLWVHWLIFGVVCLVFYLLFVHPDVIETANHSYLLLDSLFKGRFLDFYNYVMEHPFGKNLYYINNAHYNIVIYIIFAVAELPVFLFNSIFGTAVNEPLLYYIGKLVSTGFFFACLPVIKRIALQLGFSEQDSNWAPLFFAAMPPAFFSAIVMGQYDSLCLFFLLMGFLNWLRGKPLAFTLWFGVGAACKFFPLLLFVPLLLLIEKRPLHIIKYGLLSLWLVAPTTLLFLGRTGDMGTFNNLMMERLFAVKMPAAANVAVFPLLFLLLCFACYLWAPKPQALARTGLWACLAAFGILFLFVSWHPQWLILITPFLIFSAFAEKNRTPWFWLNLAFSVGFFLFCALGYPHQLEANLFDFGLPGIITGMQTTSIAAGYNSISFYYNSLLAVINILPMALVGGGLIAYTLFTFPGKNGTPANRLSGDAQTLAPAHLGRFLWGGFGAGIAVWLLPTLFTWFKCFGLL